MSDIILTIEGVTEKYLIPKELESHILQLQTKVDKLTKERDELLSYANKVNDAAEFCLTGAKKIVKERDDAIEVINETFSVTRDSYDPQYANPTMFEKLKEVTELQRDFLTKIKGEEVKGSEIKKLPIKSSFAVFLADEDAKKNR